MNRNAKINLFGLFLFIITFIFASGIVCNARGQEPIAERDSTEIAQRAAEIRAELKRDPSPSPEGPKLYTKMNVNTAPVDSLVMVPGIGEATAKRIINLRLTEKFKDINDICRRVPYVGEIKGAKMEPFLKFD